MWICIKKYWLDILGATGIFVTALLLRIPWSGVFLSRDSVLYLQIAETWYQSGKIPFSFHSFPLVIYIYSLFPHIGVPVAIGGIFLNIVLGAFLPVILFYIGTKLTGNRLVGLAAALLTAFSPFLIPLSSQLQRDNIFLFFCAICAVLMVNDFFRKNLFYPVWFGIFFALAQLCRIEGAELLLIFLGREIYLLFEKKYDFKTSLSRTAVMMAVFLTVCALLIWQMQCFEYMVASIKKYSGIIL